MKSSIAQKIYIILFSAIIICFGVYLTIDCFFISKNCLPEIGISKFLCGDYQNDVSECLNKNMYIYKPMKAIKTNFDMLTGKSFVNGVYIKDSSLTKIPQFPNISNLESVAEKINKFNDRTNQPIYSLTITTKTQIDNDQFISYIFKSDESSLISEYNNLLKNDIFKLDAITPLTYIKNMNVYYKTDSRLTGLGSFLIYNYNMKQLGVSPFSMRQFNIEHAVNNFYGELYDKIIYSNVDSDTIDLFHYNGYIVNGNVDSIYSDRDVSHRTTIYDLSRKFYSDKINVVFGEEAPIKNVITNSKSKNSILIFADRNIDSLIQFFAIHYVNITVVNLAECSDLGDSLKNSIEKINSKPYDQVLFAYGIESLTNTDQFDFLKNFNLCSAK